MSYDIPYMLTLKRNNTNELIYKTETDLQTQKTNMAAGRKMKGRDSQKAWNELVHFYI